MYALLASPTIQLIRLIHSTIQLINPQAYGLKKKKKKKKKGHLSQDMLQLLLSFCSFTHLR